MWRIVELDNGKYVARHLFWFLGRGYLDKEDGTRWSYFEYAAGYCMCDTEEQARYSIERFGKAQKPKPKPKVIRVIKP